MMNTKIKTQHTLTILGIILSSIAFTLPVAASAEEITTEALNKWNTETIQVIPFVELESENVKSTRQLRPDEEGNFYISKDTIIGLEASPELIGYEEKKTIIQFSGETEHGATVHILSKQNVEEEILHDAVADDNGKWEVQVEVEELVAGTQQLFVRTEMGDVQSDDFLVASFDISENQTISNTTWMTILTIGGIIILLLVLLNIIVFYRDWKSSKPMY